MQQIQSCCVSQEQKSKIFLCRNRVFIRYFYPNVKGHSNPINGEKGSIHPSKETVQLPTNSQWRSPDERSGCP